MRKFGWRMGWLLTSALACGELAQNPAADQPAFENEGRQKNEAGEAAAGAGGSETALAGAGGSETMVAGAGGVGGGKCGGRPKDLAEYCSMNACPETPEGVDLGFCDQTEYPRITQGTSSCGGLSVSLNSKWEGLTYHFDAGRRLVGVSWWSDYLDDCPKSVGRECTLQGAETTLCGDLERCDAVGLEYLCDEPDACSAFASQQTAAQQLCEGDDTVERYASSCNGSVFRQRSGATLHEWSFDADGGLIGVVATSDTAVQCPDDGYSKVVVYGNPCDAIGESDDPCGAGGQAGSNGAGGGGGA